jgi:hypothetical protein
MNVECHGKKRVSVVSAAGECHERRTNGNLNRDTMYFVEEDLQIRSTFRGCFQPAIRETFRGGAPVTPTRFIKSA